jgi:hypothetical protein
MFKLFFGEVIMEDTTLQIPLSDTFKKEGEWLKAKRAELITKDKHADDKKLLVNNPTRDLTLLGPTVL